MMKSMSEEHLINHWEENWEEKIQNEKENREKRETIFCFYVF